jgi:hypothetical protein
VTAGAAFAADEGAVPSFDPGSISVGAAVVITFALER